MTLYINHDKRLILYGDEAAVGFMLEDVLIEYPDDEVIADE